MAGPGIKNHRYVLHSTDNKIRISYESQTLISSDELLKPVMYRRKSELHDLYECEHSVNKPDLLKLADCRHSVYIVFSESKYLSSKSIVF